MTAAATKGTILITGANGGLGSAIVEQIASLPELSAYYGLYTVRDATSAPALSSALLGRGSHSSSSPLPPHQYEVLSLDLTKRDNVRQVAQDVNARVSAGQIPPIRAIILNAGFQDFGKQSRTDDGLDVTFAANYLGHWLLVLLLLKSMDKEAGRIIVIGSQAHDPNDKRNARTGAFLDERYKTFLDDEVGFEAIARGTWSSAEEDGSFRGGFRRYGAAKLFLIMMMYELQRRLDREPALENICVVGVDPGTMISGLQRLAPWVIRVLIFKVAYPILVYLHPNGPVRPTRRSASDVLEAAFGSGSGELPNMKGLYLDGREPLETSAESRDTRKQKLVWTETVRLVDLKERDTILSDWQ